MIGEREREVQYEHETCIIINVKLIPYLRVGGAM